MTLTRRRFLQTAAGGVAAWSLRSYLGPLASAAVADHTLVHVFCRGGLDGLSAVPPLGDPHYGGLRPTVAVPADRAIQLDGFFGLHPALAPLAEPYADGDLAVVHAVGQPDGTRSHFEEQERIERGVGAGRPLPATGWVGRYLDGGGDEGALAALSLTGAVPSSHLGHPTSVGLTSVEGFGLRVPGGHRAAAHAALRALHGGATAADAAGRTTLDAIDGLAARAGEPRAGYARNGAGAALGELARLLAAGEPVRVATIDIGGWDHHAGMGTCDAGPLRDRLADLGDALARFWADGDGWGGRVTVVVQTEFGRRAAENANGGADHGAASVMLVLGRGVNGGRVFGDWPGLGPDDLDRGDLRVTTDARDVLAELMNERVGNHDLAHVFPDHVASGHALVGLD